MGIFSRVTFEFGRHAEKLEIVDGVVSVCSEHDKQFDGVKVW